MAESDNQEDDLDLDWDDGDTGSDMRVEETEHTVIDTELGALIRAAADDKAVAEDQPVTTESALADLGPAFPGEDSFSIHEPDISTRVLEDSATDQSIESTRLEANAIEVEIEVDTGNDDWGGPPIGAAEPDSVTEAWAELDDKGSAWDALSGRSVVRSRPTGMDTHYSRADTGVYKDIDAPTAQEGGRLIGVEGICKGEEFPIIEGANYIGRAVSNEILIEDPSISRIHALITWKEGVFRVVDKESNNGVYLNGDKVDDAELSSGDEVCLGNVLFRFIEVGDVFKSTDEAGRPVVPPSAGQKWRDFRGSSYFWSVLTSGAILLVTVALVSGIIISRSSSGPKATQSDAVFQYFLNGIEAFKKREWANSENQFSILLGLDPKHLRTQQYLEAIAIERRAEEQLKIAQQSRAKGDLREAYARARDIGDSIYFSNDGKEIVRNIDLELDTRVARAKSSIEAGQLTEALSLLADVEAIRAGRPEVAALRDMATRALKEATPKSSVRKTVVRPKAVSSQSVRRVLPGKLGEAQKRFEAGNVIEAIALLEGDRSNLDARMLGEKMRDFHTAYQAGLDAHRAKRAGPGITLLSRALELEGQLSNGQSTFVGGIKKKLADLYYVQGSQAFGLEDWEKSFQSYSKAVGYVPGYERATKGLESLAQKAVDFYNEAYVVKDSDPTHARTKWQLVLKMVPPTNPYYAKAKSRLRALR